MSRVARGPSSHVTLSASRPFLAAQNPSATTATPRSISTTFRTPGTAFAPVASIVFALPPKTGGRATTATSIPGSVMSSPKTAVPSTFDGVSSRFVGLPMSLKSLGSLSATSFGGDSRDARSTSDP